MTFPMYPATDRQRQMVDMAGALADLFAQRAATADWNGTFPKENYTDLQKAGYLTLTVPRDFGGWGADLLEVTLAQQRLGQGDASTALVMSMHLLNIARLAEQLTGPNALFAEICRAVVEDGAVINTAASEPATGSPSRGGRPATTARRQQDGSWLINGRKTYTTGSPVLSLFLVTCAIEDGASNAADLPPITADRGTFLVPRHTKGVRVEETWNSLAMRGSGSHDLILEQVHVKPEAYVDGQIPNNPTAQTRAGAWTFSTTAVYLGIAEAARNAAINFARHRKPNSLNKPIASLPHIQEKAARMELALLQSRAVLYGMAAQFCANPNSINSSDLAAAKYLVSNYAVEVVDTAMRLVGAASLSLSSPLQRYYRDVRAGLSNPPMDDAAIAMIGKNAFEE